MDHILSNFRHTKLDDEANGTHDDETNTDGL